LTDFIGGESPVSQATVANAAEELETSVRSVSSKLRKMGFDVELASASATKSFSDEQESALANMQKLHQTLKAELFQLSQFKVKSFLCS